MFGGWAVAAAVDFGGFASVDGATFGGFVFLIVFVGESVKFLVHGLIIALIWGRWGGRICLVIDAETGSCSSDIILI